MTVKPLSRGKKSGPSRKVAPPGTKVSLGLRVTADTKARIDDAAYRSGRSQSEEATWRIERSFDHEDLLLDTLRLAFGEFGLVVLLLAYRMQTAVPEILDVSKEPDDIVKLYGSECLVPGSYAANCLLARKLSENGVRFVQLYHQGWDQHGNLPNEMKGQAKDVDQPSAALITDLKQRGLLDETLVVWGGEFGRTPMQENREGKTAPFKGRDHHTDAFCMWMAGGGIKGGTTYGETDEIGYTVVEGKLEAFDIQATILNQLGFDHEKFTYEFQGRPFRLTDVKGKVIQEILA